MNFVQLPGGRWCSYMQKKQTKQGSKVLDTHKKIIFFNEGLLFPKAYEQVCNSGLPHSRVSVDFRGLEIWGYMNNFDGQKSHSRAQQVY